MGQTDSHTNRMRRFHRLRTKARPTDKNLMYLSYAFFQAAADVQPVDSLTTYNACVFLGYSIGRKFLCLPMLFWKRRCFSNENVKEKYILNWNKTIYIASGQKSLSRALISIEFIFQMVLFCVKWKHRVLCVWVYIYKTW